MTCTAEIFRKAVAKHVITVLKDDGVYRHMRIADPLTFCGSYHITTWPGYLAYSGDMGDYVFARINDMFEFFRGKSINPGYWAEKVQAACRDGVKEYSPTRGREYLNEMCRDLEVSDDVKEEVAQIDTDVREDEFRTQLRDFTAHPTMFDDAWEADLNDYTYRYLWCCYALVWGIDLYDKAKQVDPKEEAIEAKAREIYAAMDGSGAHPWVVGGNSTMQDEARYQARKLLRGDADK